MLVELPKLVICFRHCDKLRPCVKGAKYPECCNPEDIPPQSCNDCSPKGYQRAAGLGASLSNLLSKIAPGESVTGMYAASSKDILDRCPRSRRPWELLVPLSSTTSLPLNTNHCAAEQEEAVRDILSNHPGGIVVASWEHSNIPKLVGWLMALAENPKATTPDMRGIPGWHGDVYDQYWVVDLRGSSPTFSIYPENILPGDCPYARYPDGKCPSGELIEGLGDTSTIRGRNICLTPAEFNLMFISFALLIAIIILFLI
jgi:hypothetical protein